MYKARIPRRFRDSILNISVAPSRTAVGLSTKSTCVNGSVSPRKHMRPLYTPIDCLFRTNAACARSNTLKRESPMSTPYVDGGSFPCAVDMSSIAFSIAARSPSSLKYRKGRTNPSPSHRPNARGVLGCPFCSSAVSWARDLGE